MIRSASPPVLPGRGFLLTDAWATNTVNTVIFRHHAVLTRGRFQYGAYYRDPESLCVFQRDLLSAEIGSHVLSGSYNLVDAHNSISLGMDRDHHLHLSYDQHASALRYRRALIPCDVTSWSEELPIGENTRQIVTYPTFLVLPDGRPMMLLYRDGHHDKGDAKLGRYDERTRTWSDIEIVLSGSRQSPWTSNAYWNRPAIGRDGSLHLGFVWRNSTKNDEGLASNKGMDYAKSYDNGRSWASSRGRPFALPITQVNSETVWPIPPESNLMNQCGMTLDQCLNPHIVYYADDEDGIVQYFHLWFAEGKWRNTKISARSTPLSMVGGGTLKLPISRPDLVIDGRAVVYVIYRGDLTDDRLVAQRLLPPDYRPVPGDVRVLWKHDVGFAEPIIDHLRWHRDGILSMLVQWNDQPDHDRANEEIREPIFVVDWDIGPEWDV
jgi:hypothetical protein